VLLADDDVYDTVNIADINDAKAKNDRIEKQKKSRLDISLD
jgi:hypothetical protein